jgi:hypothetical protein
MSRLPEGMISVPHDQRDEPRDTIDDGPGVLVYEASG